MVDLLRYTFLSISLLGFYLLWVLPMLENNLFSLYDRRAEGDLPGTPNDGWITNYTGIAAVDMLAKVDVLHFWSLASGDSLFMSLHFVVLLGTIMSTWVLLTLEACRTRPLAQVIPRYFNLSLYADKPS
jgi:hypothetical protein